MHVNILEHQPVDQEQPNTPVNANLKRANSQQYDSDNSMFKESKENLTDQIKYAKIQLVIEDNGVGISKD